MPKRNSTKIEKEEPVAKVPNKRIKRQKSVSNKETPTKSTRRSLRSLDVKTTPQNVKSEIPPRETIKKSSGNKGKTGRKRGIQPIATEEDLRQEPSRIFVHTNKELATLFKKFWNEGPYPCVAINKKCGNFPSIEKSIEHHKKCVVPMYYSFENRLEEFHILSKEDKLKYAREVIYLKKEGKCIPCGKVYSHPNAFLYHIERCGIKDTGKIPWKCWRCGFEGTQYDSKMHLLACTTAAIEAVEETNIKLEANTEKPLIFGALDDVNLRSGKAIERSDNYDTISPEALGAQEAVERLMALGTTKSARKRINIRPSISTGILPQDSSRVTLSNTGQPRYKFRKAIALSVIADFNGWENYKSQVELSFDDWKRKDNSLLPDSFANLKQDFGLLQDLKPEQMAKSSVSFHFKNETMPILSSDAFPNDARSLKLFESLSTSLDENNRNWITVSYAGGPINNLKFAPNAYSDTEEVLMVTCYPDDENLLEADWKKSRGQVQFWIVKHGKDSNSPSEIKPWFVLETKLGTVLSATWLDVLPFENDSAFIGYIAIGTIQGYVAIYRIDKTSIPLPKDTVRMVLPEPLFVLCQAPGENKALDAEKDENANSNESEEELYSPILKLDWCSHENSRYLAAITATGAVVVWDFNADLSNPKFLRDSKWPSPATDLCFSKEFNLVVAFRDKSLQVYDISNWELLLEDNLIRTAGSRVISSPRVFNGFMTFQSEYFSSTTTPTTGISYLCLDEKSKGYFVVPLANRHDLQMWDASIHPTNGILATSGVDGQLLLSANGRVAPKTCKFDSDFSIIKESMLITKRRLAENNEDNEKIDCVFNYNDICKKTWLEISLEPSKSGRVVPYASSELRTQSLNVVAVNYSSKTPVVVTGGQAGLLFIRPCRLDIGGSSVDPLELVNSLTPANRFSNLKNSKKRNIKIKEEEEDSS